MALLRRTDALWRPAESRQLADAAGGFETLLAGAAAGSGIAKLLLAGLLTDRETRLQRRHEDVRSDRLLLGFRSRSFARLQDLRRVAVLAFGDDLIDALARGRRSQFLLGVVAQVARLRWRLALSIEQDRTFVVERRDLDLDLVLSLRLLSLRHVAQDRMLHVRAMKLLVGLRREAVRGLTLEVLVAAPEVPLIDGCERGTLQHCLPLRRMNLWQIRFPLRARSQLALLVRIDLEMILLQQKDAWTVARLQLLELLQLLHGFVANYELVCPRHLLRISTLFHSLAAEDGGVRRLAPSDHAGSHSLGLYGQGPTVLVQGFDLLGLLLRFSEVLLAQLEVLHEV